MSRKPTYGELEDRLRDIEARHAQENSMFDDLCPNVSEFFYEQDIEGNFTHVSPKYVGCLGFSRDDLIGRNIRTMMPPGYRKHFDDYLKRVAGNGKDEGLMQVIAKSGDVHIIEYRNIIGKNTDGADVIRGIAKDFTERLETEQALIESDTRFKTILNSIEDGYFEVDLKGDFIFFNNRIPQYMGYSHDEMMDMNYSRLMNERTRRQVFDVFHHIFLTGESQGSVEWEFMKKDGSPIFVEISISLRANRKGEPTGFRGIIRDVTDRKRTEQELAYMAYHDTLTGLKNRKAFHERLEETIREARRYENKRAVLYIDLDGFKKVNDIYGHEIGDKLLVEVTSRLKETLRETDYISRLGGDEFTVILSNLQCLNAERVAERLTESLCRPYKFFGVTIDFISSSIGVSLYPDDGRDPETLVKHADQAMYKAKETKNCYVVFSRMTPGPARKEKK